MTNRILSWIARILDPEMARGMVRDGAMDFGQISEEQKNAFVEVEDRGSDVTIFSFAGLAVLYAGMPAFEFGRLLRNSGADYNLVFFRDIHRLSYHVSPHGEPDGLEFYETHVRRIMAELGSTYHVSLGVSVGGSAAFYFGARCAMDQVIAFNPAYPLTIYSAPWQQIQTWLNVQRLCTNPKAYGELLLVTLATAWAYRRLCRKLDADKIWPVVRTYRDQQPRPRATVFYSEHCAPDARQVAQFDGLVEVCRRPIPTVYHNCAGYLKRRGELGRMILDEIREGFGGRMEPPPSTTPEHV